MTHRLVIGIDPGQSGALVSLADGAPDRCFDMPTMARKAGGNEVDAAGVAGILRGMTAAHPEAYTVAVLEAVSAMPDQGVTGAFRFGESFGIVKGALGALRIPVVLVPAVTWKRRLGLTGCPKDAARTLAIQRFPASAELLARKKDIGRADAMLIAYWAELTEAVGPARAAA